MQSAGKMQSVWRARAELSPKTRALQENGLHHLQSHEPVKQLKIEALQRKVGLLEWRDQAFKLHKKRQRKTADGSCCMACAMGSCRERSSAR